MTSQQPTPYPDVNALLQELLQGVQSILGSHFVGMYLDGSLATGDFDQDSDIDSIVVTNDEISGDLFTALQATHDRIAKIDSYYATQMECIYASLRAIRRYDRSHAWHPNIERGKGQRLKRKNHDESWVVHLHVLRERGITLAGPAPQTLIDPVSPNDLQHAMLRILRGWAAQTLDHSAEIRTRGYQSFIVLSLCRVLYTLHFGAVASKRVAARWAQETLDDRWIPLIERAWESRRDPNPQPAAEDLNETLDMIRYALDRSQHLEQSMLEE